VGEVHDELRHHFADDPDAEVVVERRAVLVEVEGPPLPEGLRPYVDVLIFVERMEAVGSGRTPQDSAAERVASSRGSCGKAFDLVMERQEPLTRQVEAVVGLQLAAGDVDEDQFLEIEQLENG
jgi:hypothetical protein